MAAERLEPESSVVSNEAIRTGNRTLWGTALGSLLLVALFSFLILSLPAQDGPFDVDRAFYRIGMLVGLGEHPKVDPAGVLGALGTVAIAGIVAVVENVRRLEQRMRDRQESPGRSDRENLKQRHIEQIITLVEFMVNAFASGTAAVLMMTFAAAREEVLALIAGILTALLWLGTWRFLTIFYRVDRVEFRPSPEAFAKRATGLLERTSRQRATSFTFWFLSTVLTVLSAESLVGMGIPREIAAVVTILSLSVGLWICEAARAGIFEFGVARIVTIALAVVGACLFSCGVQLLVVFGGIPNSKSPPSDAATVWFLAVEGMILIVLALRGVDRAGVLHSWSSAGLQLADRLVLPRKARTGVSMAGNGRDRVRVIPSFWFAFLWFVFFVGALAVPMLLRGTDWVIVIFVMGIGAAIYWLSGLARWASGVSSFLYLVIGGMLVLLMSSTIPGVPQEQTSLLASMLLVAFSASFFYVNVLLLVRIGATPPHQRALLTALVDYVQVKSAKRLRGRIAAMGVTVSQSDLGFVVAVPSLNGHRR